MKYEKRLPADLNRRKHAAKSIPIHIVGFVMLVVGSFLLNERERRRLGKDESREGANISVLRDGLSAKASYTNDQFFLQKQGHEESRRDDSTQDMSVNHTEAEPELLSYEHATVPYKDLPTIALQNDLQFGLRNEVQALMCFIMGAMRQKIPQILIESIKFKDAFGTNERIPFENLFDVVHWNSHYPALPRLVTYDPTMHPQWNDWKTASKKEIAKFTKPRAFPGVMNRLLQCYWEYTTDLEERNLTERNPAELLILQGALRPNQQVQQDIDRLLSANADDGSSKNFIALHARVEPDMQFHNYCISSKVLNLSDIFDMIQKKFPDPPSDRMFISINRNLLEHDVSNPKKDKNQIAVQNLSVLNNAVANGLWDGRVKVFEKDKPTVETAGVFGALTSYFMAIESGIFIGTEVSSYSMDAIATRFYRGNKNNYLYLPDGLVLATPENAVKPPRFKC
jgi:hypothetical protein